MSIDAFIAEMRKRIEQLHLGGVTSVIGGALDPKGYGYGCGYLKALDDVARPRSKDDDGGIIEQILQDMRKE